MNAQSAARAPLPMPSRTLVRLALGLACAGGTFVLAAHATPAWAEPAVNAVSWVGGTTGLFPAGHEFPDRDLPSLRATRSALETDLIRLEGKSGPGAPPSAQIAERRRLFNEGEFIRAGAPWRVTIVGVRGEELASPLQFR